MTIVSQQGASPSYEAYPVFYADVDQEGKATHLTWASEAIRDDTLRVLDEHDYQSWLEQQGLDEGQHGRAQNAAAFLEERYASADTSERSKDAHESVSRGILAHLARTLCSNDAITHQDLKAGESRTLEQGYWLIVTAENSDDTTTGDGSAPLWVLVGSNPVTIHEKTGTPSLVKQVQPSDGDAWDTVASLAIGTPCTFRLSGSLSTNFSAFAHYRYQFVDHLGPGIALEGSSSTGTPDVAILINDKPVSVDGQQVSVSVRDHTLTVDFADLAAAVWEPYHLDSDSKITVTYRARLTAEASCQDAGNPNSAHLVYTNDPVHESLGSTGEVTARLFTHTLIIKKQDADTGNALAGASFTVMRKDRTAQGDAEAYVQEDGSLGGHPHAFTTGNNGQVTVPGLDEGTYLITEEKPPEGYLRQDGPIELELSATLDAQQQRRTELSAEATGKNAVIDHIDATEGAVHLSVANTASQDSPTPSDGPLERLAQTGVGPIIPSLFLIGTLLLAWARHPRPSR